MNQTSKMHHISAQLGFEGIFGLECAKYSKKFLFTPSKVLIVSSFWRKNKSSFSLPLPGYNFAIEEYFWNFLERSKILSKNLFMNSHSLGALAFQQLNHDEFSISDLMN